jgi:hypothetical protein
VYDFLRRPQRIRFPDQPFSGNAAPRVRNPGRSQISNSLLGNVALSRFHFFGFSIATGSKNAGYDPVKDFAPVTLLANTPIVLVVNKTLPEIDSAYLRQLTPHKAAAR